MPTAEASSYPSPFILDLEMSENPEEPDSNFFDVVPSFLTSSSPGAILLDESKPQSYKYRRGLHASASVAPRPDSRHHSSFSAVGLRTVSAPSGSTGYFQDSSSDASMYKRKSSSGSSHSAFPSKDILMADAECLGWNTDEVITGDAGGQFGGFDGTVNPSTMNNAFGFNDKVMENDFDFDSAASSPSPFGGGPMSMASPEMPTIKSDTLCKSSLEFKLEGEYDPEINSQHSVTHSMNGLTTNGSREASPLSAVVTSQNSSPLAFFNSSPSPTAGLDFVSGPMLGGVAHTNSWSTNVDYGVRSTHIKSGLTPPTSMNTVPSPFSSGISFSNSGFKTYLTIHPTPLKSRVETQIPIKLTLYPMPPGITKLHLPLHTISKPKLLSKPPHEKSADTLELYTALVCTSAMQNPEYRRRAFTRAATTPQQQENRPDESEGSLDEDHESKPLNGGEVKICPGCITRERKRAARKKVKRVEEEESWHKDERRRVIVFNTQEVKEWQQPSGQVPSESTGVFVEPIVPEGAMQVDAPMRIACYCRHQNEKLGFQVIFTIKDFNGRLVAQEITSSIMITDDHKTHNMPLAPSQTSNGAEGPPFPNSSIFPEATFDIPMAPFRMSHSSSDLQSLQRNYPSSFSLAGNTPVSSHQPQAMSVTMAPPNMSCQVSPTSLTGPNKKRKASGSGKIPSGLAMTRLETRHQTGPQNISIGSAGTTPSTAPSLYAPLGGPLPLTTDHPMSQLPKLVQAVPQQYSTGPPTPNSNDQGFFSNTKRSHSMENISMHQLYSAPTSAHPSRAPSPNGLRSNVQAYQQHQAQIAQAATNGFYGVPLTLNPHQNPPIIHKMIPNEGPKAGGIEVTCLGSGFYQGLEVMFGETKATTTTYWGETSLVCLLPPAAFACTVPVTFKHQYQQQQIQPYPTPPLPKQQTFFKYVDDDESQLIRTALLVLGHKMGGKIEDVRDLARRIVGDSSSSWGVPAGQSPSGSAQNQQLSGLTGLTFGLDVEQTLLKCLDLIDLDDSPNVPRLNLRRASGHTMLHLACSLGLHRFVAALLARGANPDLRDKGGFTPMHFAALYDHPQIVRRLLLSGADSTIRSLQGYTPSDLSVSEEVLRATKRMKHHTRTRSGGSLRSKTSSAISLRSLWEPLSPVLSSCSHANDEESDQEFECNDDDEGADDGFWMASRRASIQGPVAELTPANEPGHADLPPIIEGTVGGLGSPTAAMTAFKDQLSAQIQNLQQTVHFNLPNLPQMPTLAMMPNLPDYHAYLPTSPMVRRISSLVGNSRPETAENSSKDTDYRWWGLFSGAMPAAPPAYDDIFPQSDRDLKMTSATQAAADTLVDDKCSSMFDSIQGSSTGTSSTVLSTSVIKKGHVTREQQDELRLAHAEKVKRLQSDRNLFFIWIPLLVVIMLAMLYNRIPKVWLEGSKLFMSIPIDNAAHNIRGQ